MLRSIAVLFLLLELLSVGFAANAQEEAVQTNKAAIQQIYDEVFNGYDLDVVDELYAPDYVNHGFGAADLSLEDFKAALDAMQTALPDFEAQLEVLIAEGDWAASRVIFTGTFENDWVMADQTVAPNGETIRWSLNVVHRFEDGLLIEDFMAYDSLDLFIQLDISPLPAFIAEILTTGERAPAVMTDRVVSEEELDGYEEAFMHIMDDAINAGELEAIDVYMAEDHMAYEPFGQFTREQFKQVIGGFRTIVPDLTVTVDTLVREGDWLAARLTYEGTFSNELSVGLLTIQPTNKPIRFIVNVFVQYNEDGLSIVDYKEYNRLGWLRQVELLPAAS